MKRTTSLAFLLSLALTLSACGGADPADLDGTEWLLISLDGANLVPGSTITLTFQDEEIAGTAGCNSYGGSYNAERAGSFESGMIFSTLMACLDEGVMEQESLYLSILGEVSSWQLSADGSGLDLRSDEGGVLRFRLKPEEPSASLEGTRWLLTSFIDDIAASSLIAGTEISLEFEAGELSGSAGCNTYGGSYDVDGGSLEVGVLFNTEMACMEPEGLMDQESEYLSILGAASSYTIDGQTLRIDTSDGQALSFTAE